MIKKILGMFQNQKTNTQGKGVSAITPVALRAEYLSNKNIKRDNLGMIPLMSGKHIVINYNMHTTELEKAEAWAQNHKEDHKDRESGTIPSEFTVKFYPNSVGQGVVIGCPYCDKTCDVTNIDLM